MRLRQHGLSFGLAGSFWIFAGACDGGASAKGPKCGELQCAQGETCEQGKCVQPCTEGRSRCGDACVELDTDAANCGSCGNACVAGIYSCMAGACEPQRRWEKVQTVDTLTGSRTRLLFVDAAGAGHAVAAWTSESRKRIWVSRYEGDKWSASMLLGAEDGGDMREPALSIDEQGNILAVWVQGPKGGIALWGRYFDAAKGSWGEPVQVSKDTGVRGPVVTVDTKGTHTIVWGQFADGGVDVHARRVSFEGGVPDWATEVPIESHDKHAAWIDLAVDHEGNVHAAWTQRTGLHAGEAWANRYDAGTKRWGEAQRLETRDGEGTMPKLGVDAQGRAVVVWYEGTSGDHKIYARHWDPGLMSWSPDRELSDIGEPTNAQSARLGVAQNGDALATWNVYGMGQYFSRYDAASDTWTPAQAIPREAKHGAEISAFGVDAQGHAVAVWSTGGEGSRITAAQYWVDAKTWTKGVPISAGTAKESEFSPVVSYDARGDAVVVWKASGLREDEIRATWLRPNPPRAQ